MLRVITYLYCKIEDVSKAPYASESHVHVLQAKLDVEARIHCVVIACVVARDTEDLV